MRPSVKFSGWSGDQPEQIFIRSGSQAEAASLKECSASKPHQRSAAHIGVRLDQILASQGVALNESAQHLSVVSEAMLRLASLLRTNHLLGGSESSTLIKELNLAIAGFTEELAPDEG